MFSSIAGWLWNHLLYREMYFCRKQPSILLRYLPRRNSGLRQQTDKDFFHTMSHTSTGMLSKKILFALGSQFKCTRSPREQEGKTKKVYELYRWFLDLICYTIMLNKYWYYRYAKSYTQISPTVTSSRTHSNKDS